MKIIKKDKNCQSIEHVDRGAFLVDAESYFSAFRTAVMNAERQVLIVGWDVDSRVRLLRGDEQARRYSRLSDLLDGVVEDNPELEVHVLVWDFAMLYALERENLPVFKLGWKTHKRVHFHMDDEHPMGASHHQKIVVVDDKVAFSGGLDLTKNRWDTRGHEQNDPRRTDPGGDKYRPFHDVQVMVDGHAAKALGDLCRLRWLRATGEKIDPPGETRDDPWPDEVRPDIRNVHAAIALTDPEFKGRPAIRQVEDLYIDSIMAAEKYIYVENQYFTSQRIGAAMAARLREEDCPEIVMVQPYKTTGWLEENTMGVMRAKLVKRLKQEDKNDRLRLYHARNGDSGIMIHGKVMVVDDTLLRIGSANLSNRSMGLDSECDLAFEAETDEHRSAVRAFRNGLVAEHLGVGPEKVEQVLQEKGSLIETVESLSGGRKTLKHLDPNEPKWSNNIDMELIDPERPVKLDRMIDHFVNEREDGGKTRWVKYIAVVLVLAALAYVWRFTEFGKSIDVDTVTGWAEAVRGSALAPLYVVLGFLAASLVVFPVTILVIVSAAVFPPFEALGYMLAGVLVSSVANYYIGKTLGRDLIRHFPGGKLNQLSKRLAESGIWAIIAVRNLPVAPYTVVNAVAGATRIRLRDFIIGTMVGMLPGLIAFTFFTDQITNVLKNPDVGNILLAGGVGLVLFVGLYFLKRRLRRKDGHQKEAE